MQYARDALKGGMSAQDVADGLVDRALKRYTADNVSVIVLKFPWAFTGEAAQSGGRKTRKGKGLFGLR
jgi:serine/threonine protein phosphatase PrpC